jgi:hypothetical protein
LLAAVEARAGGESKDATHGTIRAEHVAAMAGSKH